MTQARIFIVASVLAAFLTGCASAHGPRRVDDGVTAARWSRVAELQPGAQVEVATMSGPLHPRTFVSANASEVTLLNLEDRSLTPGAIDALRDMALRRPEYFTAMQGVSSFEQDGVRLGREGLFVAGRRIAAFDAVVATVPRDEVREIRGPVVARGSVLGTIVGAWLGFSVGVVPGLGGANAGAARAFLAGSTALGGWLGHHWSNHTVEGVVYRAP
jgi:hypothetical protein